MDKYAIIRADGAVDLVDGFSVQDVSDRFGWPGNGTIEKYDTAIHKKVRHIFADTKDAKAETIQRETLADKVK